MDKLTIEQKARRYDEALERAKRKFSEKELNYLFPELREDEDENVRKELIKFVKVNILDEERYIAWLEKQGDANALIQEASEKAYTEGMRVERNHWLEKQGKQDMIPLDKVIKFLDDQLVDDKDEVTGEPFINFQNHGAFKETFISFFRRKMLEKQGEQKSTDNVEPKFKVGEWITNGEYTWKIVEVKPLDYILQSQDGSIVDDTISYVDEQFHSFTIEDAKDGDVLTTGNFIFIFKYIDNGNGVHYYCHYQIRKHEDDIQFGAALPQSLMGRVCNSISHYFPATKEQRDTLMKAMTDAGYIFDFEKKELKKLEQKSATMSLDEAIEHCKEKSCGNNACALEHKQLERWLTELKELKEQKSAWSEEDENIISDAEVWLDTLCDYLKDSSSAYIPNVKAIISKLESLKGRVLPRQEWNEEDERLFQIVIDILDRANHLGNISKTDLIACVRKLKSLKGKVQPRQEWKQENTDDLTDFENAMMHIGGSFFGQQSGLDPNDTDAIKEQANLLLKLVPKQEWSEEDKLHLSSIIRRTIASGDSSIFGLVKSDVDWLKSIEQRIGG